MTKPVIIVTEPEYRKATLVWPTVSDFTIVACSPDEKTLANSIIEHNAIGCIIGPEPYKGP
ncbi:MAG: hypothetical protein K9N51_09355, partial [Candidatus Pacebacteria bacterium]|nr:hypothetical protein [Candidatus Paceibacterota bacterium]